MDQIPTLQEKKKKKNRKIQSPLVHLINELLYLLNLR